MKKILILILTAVILTMFGCSSEEKIISKKEIAFTDNWEMAEEDKKMGFNNQNFMFIYGRGINVMTNDLFDKLVGPADYKEDYLYVMDYTDDKVYQLSTQPVDNYHTTRSKKYLFVYNNEMYMLSDDFESCTSIYKATGKIKFNVSSNKYDSKIIYFTDDDMLVKFNMSDNTYEILADKCYGESIYVKNDLAAYCTIHSENETGLIDYIINFRDKYRRAVINIEEFKMFDYDDDFLGQETEYTYKKSDSYPNSDTYIER